jgi:hypothetical protein
VCPKTGDVYTGEWRNGKKEGYGTFIWAKNGARYEGEWVNNIQHGKGTYIKANGDIHKGEWR